MIQKCTPIAVTMIFMLFAYASAFAQQNLEIELSNSAPEAGELFSITFTATETSALFYYGLEVGYDESRFAFSGVSAGELMGENPLQIADTIAPSTIGASVVRTSGSGEGTGSVITLEFMTLSDASAGEAIFIISNADLRNTAGAPIEVIVDESISVTVPASETFTVYYNNPDGWANVNAYTFAVEGGEYKPWPGEAMNLPEEGSVWYSYDIPVNFNRVIFNDGEGNQTGDLIRNSDGWFDGTQWYDSEPNLQESRLVTFSVDMSVQAGLGNFDITLDDMVYVKGDFNEFTLDNPMIAVGDDVYEAEIEIFGPAGSEREFKFFIEAGDERELPNGGWELLNDDPGLNRSFLLGEDDVDQILPLLFFNDDEGDAPEPESRLVTFSVDMSVQAGLGNFDITLDDMVYVKGDFNEFTLDNPMIAVGDDVYEAEIEIFGPAGSEREFKFFIEAGDERELPNEGWELLEENPDLNRSFMLEADGVDQILSLVFFNDDEGAVVPEFVTVWPGDTNNDGVVNEEDVLPLAIYWNQTGPARENATVEWTGQQAEVWIPAEATFADTDGSGLVNQTDLLAIGLNFGETHGDEILSADPIGSVSITSLNTGDRAVITVSATQTTALQGLSFAFETEGVGEELFTTTELEMGDWAELWKESGSLIEFNRVEGVQLSGARAHKGLTNPEVANELLSFVIEATQNWTNEAQLNINRMSYINAEGEAVSFGDLMIDVDIQTGTSTGGTELPRETALNQNYPNPFNPTTNIAFDLSENSVVTIEVVNVLGQRIALLVNRQEMTAGNHVQTFDARRLTSGVYLVRMTAGSQIFTRKMMLVK